MIRPPLTPPPARATLKTLGKWSRPAFGLILGVRPNSPIQTTSVFSSMPCRFRSRISVRETRVDLGRELADFLVVLLVRVPAVGADLDERDARLDQATGEEAALTERRPAVSVADCAGSSSRPNARMWGEGSFLTSGVKGCGRGRGRGRRRVRSPLPRAGRAGRGGDGTDPGGTLGWVFSGGCSAFWTTNGSMAAPRKPAPMVGPPTLTIWGRSK